MYLLRGIISFPSDLFKRSGHFVARFLHFFVADGAKTEPKAEDLLEVEPLVCLGSFLVLYVFLYVIPKTIWEA